MKTKKTFFEQLGVYGFDNVEPLIIAALVSEDPVLLIGKAGTGKTFLLNSISEAMGLEHRHYNASLISFDDLVGFPYPSSDGKSISFLPTPATIWEAESVLVDEISRCKPETQNKFFSIVHERKVQGLELKKLRYRWAAMNPFGFDGGDDDVQYEGSQPLDQALADRFSFVIEVPDWGELTIKQQEAVIYPAGESAVSDDQGTLKDFVNNLKPDFIRNILHPSPEIVSYSRIATTWLTEAGYRMSPRRARLLSRNLTAVICVEKSLGSDLSIKQRKDIYKKVLKWSLPHRAWRGSIQEHIIDSVHAEIIRVVFDSNPKEKWVSEFLMISSLADKISMLFDEDMDRDTKSLSVIQLLARESKARAAIFSFTLFPLLCDIELLNEEALHELSRFAKKVMEVIGTMEWRENLNQNNTIHPSWSSCLSTLNKLPKSEERRIERTKQLFLYLINEEENIVEPDIIEKELHECFNRTKSFVQQIEKEW